MKKLAGFVLIALLGAVAPAVAADLGGLKDGPVGISVDPSPKSWTGVFIGANGGCETGQTDVALGGFVDFNGIGSSGCSVAPVIGADYQFPNSRLVIGVEGEYRWSNDKASLHIAEGGDSINASATFDHSWLLSGRLGIAVSQDTLVYGRLGYGQAEGGWSASANFDGETVGHASGDLPTFDVIAYGAGIETRNIGPLGNAALTVEYRHLDYSKETVAQGVTIDPDLDQGLVGLKWRFGR